MYTDHRSTKSSITSKHRAMHTPIKWHTVTTQPH
uniref:Uncharacterized protein n=1 Tax=Arundo donax TaxID=35708 RepID=A0A0A8Z4N7_ARUDO